MQFTTGSYTGNGIDNRWITGVGFQPDLIIVKADASQYAVWRSSSMPAGKSAVFSPPVSLFTNAIKSFAADGFQVGTHATVNQNGIEYSYSAFRDNGGGDFDVGTYAGNGVDGRNLDIVGFQPTILWIKRDCAAEGVWRVAEIAGDDTIYFCNCPNVSNRIQSFRPLGFQVGDASEVNSNGYDYYYAAFADAAGFIETGSYTGNGVDDRNIVVGFEPNMVFVKTDIAEYSVLRIDTMGAGDSGPHHNVTPTPNQIQQFAANVFQVGTNSRVNQSGIDYYWAAWKTGTLGLPTTSTTTLSTTSTTSITTTQTTTSTTTLTTTTLPFVPIPGTNPILRICDKDGCINFLKRKKQSGYRLCGWTPRIADYKRGGIWQDSPIAEGRRLAQRRFGNVTETMNLSMSGHNLETLTRESQDLRRLMEKASNYWWANWQNDPIWIEARAKCETNARYAILHRGKILIDNSPYEQPFMERLYGRTAARNLNLILERGHWMSLPPERSTSVLASARECYEWSYHLEFNGSTSEVVCGSDAGLNDLPDDAFTAEAWIRADSLGEGNTGVVIEKYQWGFRWHPVRGLWAFIQCAVSDGWSGSGFDDITPDGVWHHVAMTWNDATYNYPRIWVDGVEVSYHSTQNRGGAYISDVAYNLRIGHIKVDPADPDPMRVWDGGIGWTRLSNIVRYSANFTPPERCKLPDIDVSTVAQWIGPERSGAIIDNQEGTAARDGTQANCLFDVDCEPHCYGNVDISQALQPVADHVYVANKRNEANITHIFRYDAAPAGFSSSLVGTVPFDLLPAVPAVGDMIYFGVAELFSSLVFDLKNAHSGITNAIWEYWDGGAWATLVVAKDNTKDWSGITFGQLGINSVVWGQPDDWDTTAVNTVNAYWVRMRVTGISGAPAPPRQQNRDIYTVVWPYLEIDSNAVGGDIVALALFKQVSAGFEVDDVVVGLRSLSRGSDFSAYLNCADEQNPPGVSVVLSGNCTFENTLSTGSGREVLYTAGANGTIEFSLESIVGSQYYGVYHAYLRGLQDGGYKGSTTFSISVELGSGQVVQEQLTGFGFDSDVDWFLVNIGRLEISPPALLDSNESYDENKIIVDMGGTQNVHFYNLVLIPIDEWAARFVDLEQDTFSTNRLKPGRLLEFESTRHPKQQLRANLWSRNSDRIVGHWDKQANGPAILQANANQRLWVLASLRNEDPSMSLGSVSRPEILTWFSVEAVQRYLSMRGDR